MENILGAPVSSQPLYDAENKLSVAVVGGSGYTGQELLRLLSSHPHVQVKAVTSRSHTGTKVSDVFPNLRKNYSLSFSNQKVKELSGEVDLIFLALPHNEAAGMVTNEVLSAAKVIDLSADFRLKDPSAYAQWYKIDHANPALLPKATYGLCELNTDEIKQSRLIANPGCYATCSILALTPLLKNELVDTNSIIIDAKSGVSGAGRAATIGSHYNECNESIKAYAVTTHRHTPEIEQELSQQCGKQITLSFTPHLVPMNRGILVTAYASLKAGIDAAQVEQAYKQAYENCPFIRLYDQETDAQILPETRWVSGSNYCDISYRIDKRTGRVIVLAALDNLVKGAAGQAIQNMNIMCGFEEKLGLEHVPAFP